MFVNMLSDMLSDKYVMIKWWRSEVACYVHGWVWHTISDFPGNLKH